MNAFPFAPFLVSLESDGFCFTLHDYERISMVLRSHGDWNINRLRFVLVSLLVKDNDQESLFLKRFDEFFDLLHEDELGFAEIDLDKALDDLRKLAEGSFDVDEPRPAGFPKPRRSSVFDKKSGKGSWRTGFLALLLVCSLSLFFFNSTLHEEPEIIQPSKLPIHTNANNIDRPKEDVFVEKIRSEDWKINAGIAGILLVAILVYVFFLWKSHKIPKDKAPKWDKQGPRHFRLGTIGGKMSPFLDSETLDQLGDYLGYFQSENPGRLLNIPASVEDTIDKGGVSSLVFQKRRQIYNLLILEDAFAESLAWNTVAGKLAEGLKKRAIPVTYGRFDGSPEQFKTADGRVFRMEDLEDQRRGYLVLIFSDGKGLHRQQDAFVLESLSRWPMIAWMELREPRFWDESTDWPASCGIPVYPATKDGLVLAMGRFLTEQGTLEDFNRSRIDCRRISGCGREIRAYTERLLGDALVWAQACAMIQPITTGMADALRGEFHPLLPRERIERLFALPGTLNMVSGLKFSVPVLSVLRSGFVIRRNEEQQEDVLKFLLEKIKQAEPVEKGSIAYLAWEWQFERVRLELEPEKALKRLAELAAPESLLAPYITSDMVSVVLPSEKLPDNISHIPLRVRPKGRYALQRLGRIAKNSGIDVMESFPVDQKHWLTICLLVLFFLGISGWSVKEYTFNTYIQPTPPKIIAGSIVFPQMENSTVFVPIQLSMPELQNVINQSVPETFSGAQSNPISGAMKDDELRWSARRGVINLSGNGQRLELHVSATGRADIRGKVKAIIKIPFQAHADLGATMRATANPKIRNNWTVEPNLSASIDVTKAEIPIGGAVGKALGRPKISVRSHVQKGLEKEMVKLVKKYNRELSQDTCLREAADKEWRKLFLVERLSDTPSAWITVTPVKIIGQNFYVDRNYLSGGIGIIAKTEIVMNEKKPGNPVKPLPDLQVVNKVPNIFSFFLLGTISWEELNKTLDSKVKGKIFKDKDGSSLTVKKINISANGGNITVKAEVLARTSGWFSSPVEGIIYLSGHPVHDPGKNLFYVTELDYELNTKDMLVEAADWLLKPSFLQKLQEELIVDLNEHRKKVIMQAEQQIKKLKSELPEGISVSTAIDDLQLKHFSLSKDFLYIIVKADVKLNVSVTKLILN